MSEKTVITPGGPRDRSLTHKVPPGHSLREIGGRMQELDGSGQVVADYGSAVADQERGAETPGVGKPSATGETALDPER